MIDFVVGDDGVVVVSLDGQWTSDDPDAMVLSGNSLMVRTMKKTSAGEVGSPHPSYIFCYSNCSQLVETFETHKPLIESLNSRGLLPGMFCSQGYFPFFITRYYSQPGRSEKTRPIQRLEFDAQVHECGQ